jgi:hypothetical protein
LRVAIEGKGEGFALKHEARKGLVVLAERDLETALRFVERYADVASAIAEKDGIDRSHELHASEAEGDLFALFVRVEVGNQRVCHAAIAGAEGLHDAGKLGAAGR